MSLWLVKSDYRLGAFVSARSRGRARYLYVLAQRREAPGFAWRDVKACVCVRREAGHREGVLAFPAFAQQERQEEMR
jgi:hypothetical protein